ncbi:Rieske (2Fe-2S) protein [Kordiimonas sp. SCSIO 12603]|uniref:Rieske (2Fe-2S) protein n=1 Tax=Kordiimonas sp. SCSIO 12603 TaxID=2829596 RepID=UPI002106463C|nr:Rieske (2Fe-2S) protein [Kordiimonas sp. SCSIO 12603]UTW57539.1 Rieske (2Fe-2S) protein [Kordiimonas sp. SCSIO 12603]
MTNNNWENLGSLEELLVEDRAVVKLAGKQILIIAADDGLYAIDNRCPHEGYPLKEGSLKEGCILSCNWHGWTFNLKDGVPLMGRDPVRTYPLKVRNGELWLDMTPPSKEEMIRKLEADFEDALNDHDYSRLARTLARGAKAGQPYEAYAVSALRWSEDKIERGFGHAHAGLSDWIDLAGNDDDLRLVAFLEATGHFSWDGLQSRPAKAGLAIEWGIETFRKAIADMNFEMAVGLCEAAFDEGLRFADLKPVFLDQVFKHYSAFGHSAIYVVHAERLIEQLGRSVERGLAIQFVRHLCGAAREDLLPEFRQFASFLNSNWPQENKQALSFSGLSVNAVMGAVVQSDQPYEELWEQLLLAAAENMLSFDVNLQNAIEQPIARNIGWLDFTHAITFARAVYVHATAENKYWRSGLLQMACFVGRNKPFLTETTFDKWKVDDQKLFMAQQKANLFNMDYGEYIYSVHRLKMVCAVECLLDLVSQDTADRLLAALNRYLHSYLRQKAPAREAYQAKFHVERE